MKSPTRFISSMAVAFAIFFSTTVAGWAAGDRRALQLLLRSPTRPTMAEIKSSLADLKFAENIPDNEHAQSNLDNRVDFEAWSDLLIENGPKLIAALEYVFPGGTWAFMGRDGMAYADLFEAFYMSLGQNHRVVRLGVSKATFNRATPKIQFEFLESHGFDLKNVNKRPPFILIDPVSKGFGHQGRMLMASAYVEAQSRGINPADLLRKLNMVGMIVSTFGGTAQDFRKADKYIDANERAILAAAPATRDYAFFMNSHKVITFPQMPNDANEAGYSHHSGAWHDSYGAFRYDGQGKVTAMVGSAYDATIKESILWTQKKIWKAAHSKEFLKAVKAEADGLGYLFSVKGACAASLN